MYSEIVKQGVGSSTQQIPLVNQDIISTTSPAPDDLAPALIPKNVLLYIDNSNIFETARKYSAQQKGYMIGLIDIVCRIDVGKLISKAVGNRQVLFGKLYGSEPPALDTVWASIRKKNIEVKTFARSKWTNKEKEVDGSLIADAVEDIVEQKGNTGENRTVILFSGDRDLNKVFQKAIRHGYRVEIWAFRCSINSDAKHAERENPDQIRIKYTDDVFREVTFTNINWGNQPIPRERSLVAILSLSEYNDKTFLSGIFRSFVEKSGEIFKMPMSGKFINNSQHLVLIPCIKEFRNKPIATISSTKPTGYEGPPMALYGGLNAGGPYQVFHHGQFVGPHAMPYASPYPPIFHGAPRQSFRTPRAIVRTETFPHPQAGPFAGAEPVSFPGFYPTHSTAGYPGMSTRPYAGPLPGISYPGVFVGQPPINYSVPPPTEIPNTLVQEGSTERIYDFYKDIQPKVPLLLEAFKSICTSILPWNEYLAKKRERIEPSIISPSRFQQLQIAENEDDKDEEETQEDLEAIDSYSQVSDADYCDVHHESTDDFTPVLTKTKPKRIMYSDPCNRKFWCSKGMQCGYKHTPEEYEFFKIFPDPKKRFLYKTKLCYFNVCNYSKRPFLCRYAHSLEESRCICCGGKGNGKHWMDQCPNNKFNRT